MAAFRLASMSLLAALCVWGCTNGEVPRSGTPGAAGTGSGAGQAGTSGAAGLGSGAGGDGASGAAGDGASAGASGSAGDGAGPAGANGSAAGTMGTAGGGAGTGAAAGTSGAAGVGTGAAGDSSYPVGDPGTTGDGDVMIMGPYGTQPDLTDKGNPKGKSFMFTMSSADSKIYKGDDATLKPENQHPFTRRIDVYVPALYKDGTAAPVLIITDGPGELSWVKNALDNLTISKDPMRVLPPFIAVAVANGGGDGRGSQRGLEYDTMGDRYARFINEEVLPAVIANSAVKAAYPNLTFTPNPEGRAAMGCSSGGAAALTMGWFRPDLFHRIITYSGTFVAQQNATQVEAKTYPDGAWDYHSDLSLIMNNPRKDLRVFLNANQNDNGSTQPDTGKHNWVIANQRTAAALKAKGYHDRFIFAAGAGHCDGGVRSSTLADSLVWVWRGYPAP
jgi:enterochelin esterase-like enzyme